MYLLFDIGGSKIRLATSIDGQTISAPVILPTPQNFTEAMELLEKEAVNITNSQKIRGCAGGVAGPLDPSKSTLINAPNLPDWKNKPLKASLEKIFETPVFLENDAALVGLGEATHGAGAGRKIVAYLTISTGIGGARIVDGKIDTNSLGFEPGHQIISLDGLEIESYVSGIAIERRFGLKPEEIHDPSIWSSIAQTIAIGLNNTMVYWSPDIIVLGGGLMKKIDLGVVKSHVQSIVTIFPKLPEIEKAKLGDEGGLYGALEYLREN